MNRLSILSLPALALLAACNNSPGNGTSQSETDAAAADEGVMAAPDMSSDSAASGSQTPGAAGADGDTGATTGTAGTTGSDPAAGAGTSRTTDPQSSVPNKSGTSGTGSGTGTAPGSNSGSAAKQGTPPPTGE